MSSLGLTNMDEITMRLVHYLVTKENYQPIVVNGLENEIWLENTEKHYEVIRINSNYIHNDEQLSFDLYKAKAVIKQIKKKMLSFNCNTLNIMLNVGENVNLESKNKHMDILKIENVSDLEKKEDVVTLFPDLKDDHIDATDDMDFFINVTQDINETTEKKNRLYEKTFKKKTIVLTYLLIAINIVIYLLSFIGIIDVNSFYISKSSFVGGQYYRIITYAFFHADLVHLICNMYSLYVIGTQLETVLGKVKYLIVYFISAIFASLASALLFGGPSIGASGAIFGLVGALIYFGYHYRLYLGNVIVKELIPVVIINLMLGFVIPNVDNFGHIGGLVGGMFSAMIVGVEGKTQREDTINGIIVTVILFVFLVFMLFR